MVALDHPVADDQDEGLHRDAADQVSGGDIEVALGDGGDRDRQLGQAAGNSEQDHPAERLAQPQPVVEGVGGLGQVEAGDPRRGRCDHEEDDQSWPAE
jgi:hypothetical protein